MFGCAERFDGLGRGLLAAVEQLLEIGCGRNGAGDDDERVHHAAHVGHNQQEQNDKIAAERKSQIGSGDRSERIRTYNFPQSRITDHRINLTLYKLDSFLDGDLDEVIDALITEDQAEKMREF